LIFRFEFIYLLSFLISEIGIEALDVLGLVELALNVGLGDTNSHSLDSIAACGDNTHWSFGLVNVVFSFYGWHCFEASLHACIILVINIIMTVHLSIGLSLSFATGKRSHKAIFNA